MATLLGTWTFCSLTSNPAPLWRADDALVFGEGLLTIIVVCHQGLQRDLVVR